MRTARIVVLKAAADVAARGAAVVTFPVVATRAGPDGYGAYALILTVASFVVPFASLGMGGAMVRFVGPHVQEGQATAQFSRMARVAVGGALVAAAAMAVLAAPLASLLLHWGHAVALFRWGAVLVAAATMEQVVLEYLRAREKLPLYVGYQLTQTATTVAAVLIVMLVRNDIVLLVAVLGLIKLATVGATTLLAGRTRGHSEAMAASVPVSVSAMVRFGLPLTIAGFGIWLMNLSDRLVVGHYLPSADLGRYGAVFLFASLISLVSTPLYLPAYPRLMTAVSSTDASRQTDEIRLFHRYVALLTVPAAVLLCVVTRPLATRMGGGGFDIPRSVVVLLVAALFLDQWNGLAQYLLLCHGRTLFMQNVWLGYGVVNLLVNLIVVPRYGLPGAAAVTFCTFVLLEAHVLLEAQRLVPVLSAYRLRTTAIAAVASAVAAAAALPVVRSQDGSLLTIAVGSAVFALVYGVGMLLVGQVRVAELKFW